VKRDKASCQCRNLVGDLASPMPHGKQSQTPIAARPFWTCRAWCLVIRSVFAGGFGMRYRRIGADTYTLSRFGMVRFTIALRLRLWFLLPRPDGERGDE
jgi:hypothetical protein